MALVFLSQGKALANEVPGGTTTINGDNVVLEAPVKAGQSEANETQAPKEELGQNDSVSLRSRMAVAPATQAQTLAVYRMYNANSGEHFYTKNSYERDSLKNIGWNYEGVGWQAPESGSPVYRLYNPNSGEHFYTLSAYERDDLRKHGWNYESISFNSAANTGIPVYRVYNPNSGWHHYTLISYERDSLVKAGWRNEGVAWYAANNGQTNNDNYRLLGVRNYDQYALGAPSGCEGAALLQALQYKGKITNCGLVQFLNTIPKSTDGSPNSGFVGSPFVEASNVYSAIYPGPLSNWAKKYDTNVQNISGTSVDGLINEVKNGNPVVVWVTINFQPVRWGAWPFGSAVNNNQAVTLDGFNKSSNQVHVSDSISGSYWLNRATFETIYNARKYAVAVR
ncbi:C39 family peptidase [Lactococcus cremoris]|uniref:C39 family peptidase n=1 Tax=Lactococcus lactis subsp. cremoris TaxID=1359 RepID=UPI00220E756D|nr:C39 family peptidase [Lactococcus cremoris]UXV62087.1 C39 family peptidase [Lactococcus cremoris]